MFDINQDKITCSECKELNGSNPLQCKTCLDYANWTRILITPKGNDIVEIQKAASQAAGNFVQAFIDELPLEQLFLFMKMSEGLAAGLSLAYQARVIKERIPKVPTKKATAAEFAKSVESARDAQRPKGERTKLDQRQKLIQQFVKLGISEELATAKVDEEMRKAGSAVK